MPDCKVIAVANKNGGDDKINIPFFSLIKIIVTNNKKN